jgi:hypothetical protein
MATKSFSQILLIILCFILIVLGILFCFGGLYGIILGVISILVGALGIYGTAARKRTPLRIFIIACVIFFLIVAVSFGVLLYLRENCADNPVAIDPIIKVMSTL